MCTDTCVPMSMDASPSRHGTCIPEIVVAAVEEVLFQQRVCGCCLLASAMAARFIPNARIIQGYMLFLGSDGRKKNINHQQINPPSNQEINPHASRRRPQFEAMLRSFASLAPCLGKIWLAS